MARSKSSGRWLREHFEDPYVHKARQEGYRSRAVYKLQELDQRARLLHPGMTVVDLGAAPGGWSQYAARAVGPKGRVIALDILPMDPIAGVEFVLGDFREQEALERLLGTLGGRPVDLVISDMAPNISGVGVTDQARGVYLAELALDLARQILKPDGDLVFKLFQGAGFEEILRDVRRSFSKVAIRKPLASRPRSPEVYVVARNYIV